jgi:hypothetical protein
MMWPKVIEKPCQAQWRLLCTTSKKICKRGAMWCHQHQTWLAGKSHFAGHFDGEIIELRDASSKPCELLLHDPEQMSAFFEGTPWNIVDTKKHWTPVRNHSFCSAFLWTPLISAA